MPNNLQTDWFSHNKGRELSVSRVQITQGRELSEVDIRNVRNNRITEWNILHNFAIKWFCVKLRYFLVSKYAISCTRSWTHPAVTYNNEKWHIIWGLLCQNKYQEQGQVITSQRICGSNYLSLPLIPVSDRPSSYHVLCFQEMHIEGTIYFREYKYMKWDKYICNMYDHEH